MSGGTARSARFKSRKAKTKVAVLLAAVIAIVIIWVAESSDGKVLPPPAPGVHRIMISYSTVGSPSAESAALVFTRRDGVAVKIYFDEHTHNYDGQIRFDAFTGDHSMAPTAHFVGLVSIPVGQSAVLDGVRVTVTANWINPPYRSNAVDVILADATP